MSALTVTLGADITQLRKAMAGATEVVAASARRMGRLSASGLAGLGKGGAVALGKGFSLAGTALKASIGAAMAGGAAALGVGVKAVNAAADFEQTKVAFTTLIGDAAKAEETLARLRKLGAETPFEFPELADAGRKLIAFGEGGDTVPETLRRIGDVSAGVQAPINEIAELYGKARVQGRLFAEDINQLTGRGIPIIQELAKQFGVNDSQVKKLVESRQIGFPAIEQAFVSMTSQGGRFAGMMEAQSRTTKGLFSTLHDTINEVFLALGQPVNDAIRPLVEQAIGLVQKLAPMAAEAGRRTNDAILFVIAAFKGGQITELVTSALKIGFAEGTNALLAGIRTAVEFFWNLITDGTMWKSLGVVMLGLAASLGAALLDAFQAPLAYLQAGMEWVMAKLMKGLLMIPGMDELMGFKAEDVQTDFGKILADTRENGPGMFGMDAREMARQADAMISAGAPALAGRVAEAGRKAGESNGQKLTDTSGLHESLDTLVRSIQDSMPKPEEVKQSTEAAVKASTPAVAPVSGTQARLDPIVTSLGRVGGGGYSTGILNAQRENNRLTGETNRLIRDTNKQLSRMGVGGAVSALFG